MRFAGMQFLVVVFSSLLITLEARAQELRSAVPISSVTKFSVPSAGKKIRCIKSSTGLVAFGERRGNTFVPYPAIRLEIYGKLVKGGDRATLFAENNRLFAKHLACLSSLRPTPRPGVRPTVAPVKTLVPRPTATARPVATIRPIPTLTVPGALVGDSSLCISSATVQSCEYENDPNDFDFNFIFDGECYYEPVLGIALTREGGDTKKLAEDRCKSELEFRLAFGNDFYTRVELSERCGRAVCRKSLLP